MGSCVQSVGNLWIRLAYCCVTGRREFIVMVANLDSNAFPKARLGGLTNKFFVL